MSHCEFRDCHGLHYAGGLFFEDCTGELFNSLIVGNEGGESLGSGAGLLNCNVTVASCTFVNNISQNIEPAGALVLFDSDLSIIYNSVFWNNTTDGYAESMQIGPSDGWFDVYHCDVQYGWSGYGSGNIDVDPCFVASGEWDYCLSAIGSGQVADSPCINSGYGFVGDWQLAEYSTRTDQEPDIGTVDMGYRRFSNPASDVAQEWIEQDLRMIASPNPFQGGTTIRLQGALRSAGVGTAANASATTDTDSEIGRLQIYDLSGRLIRYLSPAVRGGDIEYSWDRRDENGHVVSPGAYFMRLENGGQSPAGAGRSWSRRGERRKVILLR